MRSRLLRLSNLVLDMHSGSFLGAAIYEEIKVGELSTKYVEGLIDLLRMYPETSEVEHKTTISSRIYSIKNPAGGRKVIGIYNFRSRFWTIFQPHQSVTRGFNP